MLAGWSMQPLRAASTVCVPERQFPCAPSSRDLMSMFSSINLRQVALGWFNLRLELRQKRCVTRRRCCSE